MDRLGVDPVACDGFGYCAELLPELVTLDEWGYPVVHGEGAVPSHLGELVRRAVADCPRRALLLVRDPEPARVKLASNRPA
ncbi:MAG: ferredoxin [Acidimicrobiales bacterium]